MDRDVPMNESCKEGQGSEREGTEAAEADEGVEMKEIKRSGESAAYRSPDSHIVSIQDWQEAEPPEGDEAREVVKEGVGGETEECKTEDANEQGGGSDVASKRQGIENISVSVPSNTDDAQPNKKARAETSKADPDAKASLGGSDTVGGEAPGTCSGLLHCPHHSKQLPVSKDRAREAALVRFKVVFQRLLRSKSLTTENVGAIMQFIMAETFQLASQVGLRVRPRPQASEAEGLPGGSGFIVLQGAKGVKEGDDSKSSSKKGGSDNDGVNVGQELVPLMSAVGAESEEGTEGGVEVLPSPLFVRFLGVPQLRELQRYLLAVEAGGYFESKEDVLPDRLLLDDDFSKVILDERVLRAVAVEPGKPEGEFLQLVKERGEGEGEEGEKKESIEGGAVEPEGEGGKKKVGENDGVSAIEKRGKESEEVDKQNQEAVDNGSAKKEAGGVVHHKEGEANEKKQMPKQKGSEEAGIVREVQVGEDTKSSKAADDSKGTDGSKAEKPSEKSSVVGESGGSASEEEDGDARRMRLMEEEMLEDPTLKWPLPLMRSPPSITTHPTGAHTSATAATTAIPTTAAATAMGAKALPAAGSKGREGSSGEGSSDKTEGGCLSHAELQLQWVFGKMEYEVPPGAWRGRYVEAGGEARETAEQLEKEYEGLKAACDRRLELEGLEAALAKIERLVGRWKRKREGEGGESGDSLLGRMKKRLERILGAELEMKRREEEEREAAERKEREEKEKQGAKAEETARAMDEGRDAAGRGSSTGGTEASDGAGASSLTGDKPNGLTQGGAEAGGVSAGSREEGSAGRETGAQSKGEECGEDASKGASRDASVSAEEKSGREKSEGEERVKPSARQLAAIRFEKETLSSLLAECHTALAAANVGAMEVRGEEGL